MKPAGVAAVVKLLGAIRKERWGFGAPQRRLLDAVHVERPLGHHGGAAHRVKLERPTVTVTVTDGRSCLTPCLTSKFDPELDKAEHSALVALKVGGTLCEFTCTRWWWRRHPVLALGRPSGC